MIIIIMIIIIIIIITLVEWYKQSVLPTDH